MAKPIIPSTHVSTVRLIDVTPIDASANAYAPPTGNLDSATPSLAAPPESVPNESSPRTLKSLDKQFGPLRIGEVLASRVELQALGATVNGQPISPANSGMQTPDQTFLDGLNFDATKVQARLKSVDIPDSGVAAMLFYEIACKRSVDAAPLFVSDATVEPLSLIHI